MSTNNMVTYAELYADFKAGLIDQETLKLMIASQPAQGDETAQANTAQANTAQADPGFVKIYGRHPQNGMVYICEAELNRFNKPRLTKDVKHLNIIKHKDLFTGLNDTERTLFSQCRNSDGTLITGDNESNVFMWSDGGRFTSCTNGSKYARDNGLGSPFARDAMEKYNRHMANKTVKAGTKTAPTETAEAKTEIVYSLQVDSPPSETSQAETKRGAWGSTIYPELVNDALSEIGYNAEQQHQAVVSLRGVLNARKIGFEKVCPNYLTDDYKETLDAGLQALQAAGFRNVGLIVNPRNGKMKVNAVK